MHCNTHWQHHHHEIVVAISCEDKFTQTLRREKEEIKMELGP